MATLDESFYDPVPGYTQTRRRRTETPPPADVPRGGMPVPGTDPLAGVPERDIIPETFADPLSPTRSRRYGPGDERDLSVPTPPPPVGWRPPSGELPPPPVDPTAPRTPFADAPGQSLANTLASGRRWQAEQDRLGLTTADMDYIRSYGRNAWDARQSKYAPPTTRADYLARQGQNLAISVAERNAAQQELSRLDADQRRQDALAADAARMAAQLRMAEAANRPVPVSFGAGAGATPNAAGGWDYLTPPQETRAPAPVSFGGGAGAIPEIGEDGRPTGRYVYQAAPTPDPNAAPWVPGGGATSVNRVTGDVKTAPGSAPDPNSPKNWKKVGSDIVNVVTNERISGYDARRALDTQIGQLRAALTREDLASSRAAIQAQIEALEAQKQALGVADAQAPEAPAATAEPAAPAPGSAVAGEPPASPAAAPAEPAPAPAQPSAPSSPTGHRRWTPGA